MDGVLLTRLEGDLVDLSAADKGDEAAAGELRVAPVGQTLGLLVETDLWVLGM